MRPHDTALDRFFRDLEGADRRFKELIESEKRDDRDVLTETPIYVMERVSDLVLSDFNRGDPELLRTFDDVLVEHAAQPDVHTVVELSSGESLYFEMDGWTVEQIEEFQASYSRQMSDVIDIPLLLAKPTRPERSSGL